MKLVTGGAALILAAIIGITLTIKAQTHADPEACRQTFTAALAGALATATSSQDMEDRMGAWKASMPAECTGLTKTQNDAIAGQATEELNRLITIKAIEWGANR